MAKCINIVPLVATRKMYTSERGARPILKALYGYRPTKGYSVNDYGSGARRDEVDLNVNVSVRLHHCHHRLSRPQALLSSPAAQHSPPHHPHPRMS